MGVDVDLGVIMRGQIESLEPDAAERVHVEFSTDADVIGRWDPDLLERVIANLVSNALKYSPPEQPIRARLTSDRDTVTLCVVDHGIGIANDELPVVFSRYGRAAGALAAGVEGHGLGLFLCKGIVEAHGGRIWAESPGAGSGASVTMVLPKLEATGSTQRQPDGEGAPVTLRTVNGNAPTVALHDVSRDTQANP